MNIQTWNVRVAEYMKRYKMAEPGDGVLAAVSGGADSVCLLLVLKVLEEVLGIRVAAFHMNHGLRGDEADRDEAYVKELCERLGVPLKVVYENVSEYAQSHGMSEEEAGRELRYRHLSETAEEFGCSKIATAHHKDDQVETVLMNLFRGSGLRGLGGIRSVRKVGAGKSSTLPDFAGSHTDATECQEEKRDKSELKIIRPLLCMERKEIEAYLLEETTAWCEDSTNRELDYVRNKIRNVLVPWVKKEINEQVNDHILKTAEFAVQADEYFCLQAAMLLGEEKTSIATEVFDAQPEIMKAYIVRAMISNAMHEPGTLGTAKDISARHIDMICALTGPGGGTEISLPYGLHALRSYDTLSIQTEKTVETMDMSLKTTTFPWKKQLEFPKNQYTKWFDYDKIKGTLSVRTREPGDYLTISGGKTKTLHRYFIDEKIPEAMRDRIPLLADGNHILWIIGYRISDYYKLSDTTQTVIEVRADKGEKHG